MLKAHLFKAGGVGALQKGEDLLGELVVKVLVKGIRHVVYKHESVPLCVRRSEKIENDVRLLLFLIIILLIIIWLIVINK